MQIRNKIINRRRVQHHVYQFASAGFQDPKGKVIELHKRKRNEIN